MEKFTNKVKLIKEGKTIFYLCDEYDRELQNVEDSIKRLDGIHRDNMMKMTCSILNAYTEYHEVIYIYMDDIEDLEDFPYAGDITVEKIEKYDKDNWHITGTGITERGNPFEDGVYLSELNTKELSIFLRGLLEIDDIVKCYGVNGVKNINKN